MGLIGFMTQPEDIRIPARRSPLIAQDQPFIAIRKQCEWINTVKQFTIGLGSPPRHRRTVQGCRTRFPGAGKKN